MRSRTRAIRPGSSGPSRRPRRHSAPRKPRTSGSSSSSRGTSGLCNAPASHALKPSSRQHRQNASIRCGGAWSRSRVPPFPAASRSAARNPSAARRSSRPKSGSRSANSTPTSATSRASPGSAAPKRSSAPGSAARRSVSAPAAASALATAARRSPSSGGSPSAALIARGFARAFLIAAAAAATVSSGTAPSAPRRGSVKVEDVGAAVERALGLDGVDDAGQHQGHAREHRAERTPVRGGARRLLRITYTVDHSLDGPNPVRGSLRSRIGCASRRSDCR